MFSGTLSRGRYARATAIRIGLYIAGHLVVVGVLWLMQNTHACSGEGCVAFTGMATAIFVLPAFYFLLIVSFIGISMRRMRDIGLPAALALAIPVLMLGDVLSGMTLASSVVTAFTHPNPLNRVPHFLTLALICIGFLCAVRGKDQTDREAVDRWGLAGALAFGIVTLNSIYAVFSFCHYIAGLLGGLAAMQTVRTIEVYWGQFGTLVLLIAMLALVILRQRSRPP